MINFKYISSLLKQILFPHAFIILAFALVSVFYFYPVLEGKVIYQSDIVQYRGMSKQFLDYQEEKGEPVYWTDSAFGGMPTYQLGAKYPNHWIKLLDQGLRFLPRPADYLFLYMLCFYVLMLVILKGEWRLAAIGAATFGFMTYHIVILGVGHNAKAHAIAYMPLVLSGLFLIFNKRQRLGFVVLVLGSGLELAANHFQMTYYLAFIMTIIGIYYGIEHFKSKQIKSYFRSVGLIFLSGGLALGMNATGILATSEYTQESTRGSNPLTIGPDGQVLNYDSGLDKSYITEYSYGIGESLNLFVPGLYGGSNGEQLSIDGKSVQFLLSNFQIASQDAINFAGQLMYWGKQPFVAAPAYIGIIILFLFVFWMRLEPSKSKYWLLSSCVLVLALSWGKNLEYLTAFFIDYVPLYNKFRAVSSIQVLLSLLVPLGAMLGLKSLITNDLPTTTKIKELKYVAISFGVFLGLLFMLKGKGFDFISTNDGYIKQTYGPDLLRAIRLDREALYSSDLLRATVLIALTSLTLFLYLKKSINKNILIVLISGYALFDLVDVSRRYLNADDFTTKTAMTSPYSSTTSDQTIQKDSTHYRVLDLTNNPFNSSRASYFHKAFGGYHAAKPKRAQHLFDYHISQNNSSILDLLNIKYVIQPNETGSTAYINESALGNAWFVSTIITVDSEDEALAKLKDIDLSSTALALSNIGLNDQTFSVNGGERISLTSYKMDELVFESNNDFDGFAVFSEMYFDKGWKATIDGKAADIKRVDYAFRGMAIPSGKHTITMNFEPEVVQKGEIISKVSFLCFIGLCIAVLVYSNIRKKA